MNNQRQIALAINMYVQDHDEAFMPNTSTVWSARLQPYNEPSLYDCPSKTGKGTNNKPEYVINNSVLGMALGDITDPSGTALIGDGEHPATTSPATNEGVAYSPTDFKLRHLTKVVVAYVDGHVGISSNLPACAPPLTVQTGLKLWMKAESVTGSTVSSWTNNVSGGNPFIPGTAPTLSTNMVMGYPAVTFNGTSQYLDQAGTNIAGGDGGFTILVAARTRAGGYGSQNDYYATAFVTESGAYFGMYRTSGGFWGELWDTQARYTPKVAWVADGTFGVGAVRYDKPSKVLSAAVNGGTAATVLTGGASATLTTGSVRLGSNYNHSAYTGCDIAEILFYNVGLSDADLAAATSYLKLKYGL
jgi:prepilin-type processing-associated H-X9-DG protein